MCDLTNPAFTNEDKAREFLEASRWPDGAVCPFCGQLDTVKPLGGKSMGPGWYFCNDCREKFTVRVGTLYERVTYPAAQVAYGDAFDGVEQERHQLAST